MIGAIIATITLFMLPFIITQIRLLKRIRKLKKIYPSIPGVFFLAEILGCCGEGVCECLYARERLRKISIEDMGYVEERAPEEHEVQLALDEKRKTSASYQSIEEEQSRVKELLSKRQKTSIMYICNITSLPKQRVIDIILAEPGYIIEHEYVINKKLLPKEEKIAIESCPQCDNPVKPNWEYCTNCGYTRK